MISFKSLQKEKASSSIALRELEIFTSLRDEQFLKAAFPISVTESGITTLFKLLQPRNAPSSIIVTEEGMIISSMSVFLYSKALMALTPSWITIFLLFSSIFSSFLSSLYRMKNGESKVRLS